MSSNQRSIVGDGPENGVLTESEAGVKKPLLQANQFPSETPFLRMLFFGSIVAAPYILAGMIMSFSAIALPQMHLNIDQASWFGSLSYFGSMFGSILVGLIIDKYGRLPSFIFSIAPCIIGWILLGTSHSIETLYLGQFLAGIIQGCIYIGQIYAAESIVVNRHHLRASFSTWTTVAIAIGLILTSALGRAMPYQMVALVAAVIAILSLLCICILIPESPHWLCQRGQIHKARMSEHRLSIHQPILKDVHLISDFTDVGSTWHNLKVGLQKLKRRDVFKPLIIMNVWFCLVVFSGGSCILAFLVDILNDYPTVTHASNTSWLGVKEEDLIGYNSTIISSVLTLVGSILSSILVNYLGIKKLFNMSSIGMAIGMVGLAVTLRHVGKEHEAMEFWRATHTASIWVISFFYALGVSTIPTSVIGEMFPYDAKGFAGLISISHQGVGGVVIKMHLYAYDRCGYYLYFIYAFMNLLGLLFVEMFVPETVGKTQEEIGEYFKEK